MVKNVTPVTVNLLTSEKSEVIPSIHTQPVRFLGRRICASLSDSENIETFISTFKFSHFMVSMERGDFVVNSQQDVPEVY